MRNVLPDAPLGRVGAGAVRTTGALRAETAVVRVAVVRAGAFFVVVRRTAFFGAVLRAGLGGMKILCVYCNTSVLKRTSAVGLFIHIIVILYANMEFTNALPLLQINLTAIFITLAVVVTADTHGLLWILGKMRVLPQTRMEVLHRLAWGGLIVIVLAGATMFSTYSEYLLTLPAFQLKMLFVLFLFLNAIFIGKHLQVATVRSFAELSPKERLPLLISGAVSTTGWIGAYICAQFI